MFAALNELIESRIAAARDRGDFDDLPGKGSPLELDDDSLVPIELRAGLRILKNAGLLPAELESLAQLRALERELDAHRHAGDGTEAEGGASDPSSEQRLRRRMQALVATLEARGLNPRLLGPGAYGAAIVERLAERQRSSAD